MPELEAKGPEPSQTWRKPLPDEAVTLGRTDKSAWIAGWDKQISQKHALLAWQNGKLNVSKLPEGKNKIFFQGRPLKDGEQISLDLGDSFVIGATTFTIVDVDTDVAANSGSEQPVLLSQLTCSHHELSQIRYVDADKRIEALATLPAMIRLSASDEQVEQAVARVLLQGIPSADKAALVALEQTGKVTVPRVHTACDRAGTATTLAPSTRLVLEAVRRRRQAVLHVWSKAKEKGFTVAEDVDSAICAPLPDEPTPGFALYVTCRKDVLSPIRHGGEPSDFDKSDLKFASLVADTFGALRQARHLQRRQTVLSQVFSPQILAAIAEKNVEDVLRARQTDVTVLFCDLRGSCRIVDSKQLPLDQIWKRLSEALHIMTNNIILQDGVIGDFQGDAAMGFWGWPQDDDDEQVVKAARAALAIRKEFLRASRDPGHILHGFFCGIGIAHGPAIAGKLGTFDQLKVSVFGPVVNLAARLESMTKVFQVPILLDEVAADRLTAVGAARWGRCRSLARVRPYGMDVSLMISELMSSAVEPGAFSEQDRGDYQAALDAFLEQRWPESRELLDRLQADGPSRFLKDFMARHDNPPLDWDGVVALDSK